INKEKIKEIAQKYNLEMVLLFGSQVNGRAKPDSDVDIAYSAQKQLSTDERIDLNNDLGDLFHKDIVDQVDIRSANPLLLHEISQNSQLLFGKEIDYLEFKAFAFRNYIDSESLFNLEDLLIKKKHKELGKLIYG
ncbi:MAG: nucleotidyltransferase domain-containing protein, partial [Candidatus Gribaldobacteria bacterium]|nr:nucleotidyltransferase domain-containing protein [Candidatus Gribaldobacteria bacterium]